jgi:hypothetical protein
MDCGSKTSDSLVKSEFPPKLNETFIIIEFNMFDFVAEV